MMDFIHNLTRNLMDEYNKELEAYIIEYFGTSDLNQLRERMKFFVIEETAPSILIRSSPYYDDQSIFTFRSDYRIRAKTEEELERDNLAAAIKSRADAILEKNVPVGKCIVCENYLYMRDNFILTEHGHYHEHCLDGRLVDDPNHY